jgi:tRNA threonylcarbamoyladenosine biosynthesis protein TsaB
MATLALDTTTREGSVALVDGGRVVAERRGEAARSHGERLPGELTALVEAAGLSLADLTLYAVAVGPGSFTGLRIGIATMQGLAFVSRTPVVPVSALDALAQATAARLEAGAIVGVWMDAQRGDVFSALYRVSDGAPFNPERLVELEGAVVGAPGDAVARWTALVGDEPIAVTGDGAVRYADALAAGRRVAPRVVAAPPLASSVGRLAEALAARGGAVSPMALRPLYVRQPDVVLARDR